MLYIILFAIFAASFPVAYLGRSIIVYLYDAKGLRRFNNLTAFSGVTDLPWVWESIRGRRYKTLDAAHRQQNVSIVRVAPNTLSFNDPRAAAAIYGHGTPATKSSFYDASRSRFKNLADTRDKQEHSRKRRLLASGYALTTLLRWEDKVASRILALLDQYDKHCLGPGQSRTSVDAIPVDHRVWMDIFTIDTIHDIGLSANLMLIEKGNDFIEVRDARGNPYRCQFRQSLWGGLRIHACFAWVPGWYPLLKRLTWWDSRWRDSTSFDNIVATESKHRIERYLAGEKLDDFSYLLEDRNGSPNMLTLGEMMAECSVMLNAGSETTGIALSNLLYLLIANPECLRKLRQEVDEALNGIEGAKVAPFDKVRYLPYLKACIDEGLRLLPPSATTTPRLTPPSGQEIMGHWIPGNTEVFCPTYSLHRTAAFLDPEAFQPERWLGDNAKELQSSFIPFSAGPRACIGRNITYMEQQMLIASLVYRYTFELVSPDFKPTYEEAVTCSPGSIPIYLCRRT